ncbi:MAG TPA: DNA cytosine methyltransferase [Thermoanaerobaculia bacterium]|nr:DNA cytosine methyltransferase [Thermoanaerobaculia bacterium]
MGLEAAGFECAAAVEIDSHACATLRLNRPHWNVIEGDLRDVRGEPFLGIDLLAGGVPCPPFSIAGKQLGSKDERDLFPEALRLARAMRPRAVLLENVPGFASAKFAHYRASLIRQLADLGYRADWRILNACDFGVAQLRPRFLLVAMRPEDFTYFRWPQPNTPQKSVGDAIGDLIASRGWKGAARWKKLANGIAPTIVGGSKKHGGPDLGPTRAKRQWAQLAVDGMGIANEPPGSDFPSDAHPKLTLQMVARLQGFPDDWQFAGRKTAAYRQVGNAFPPPVAEAVGRAILSAFARICEPGAEYEQPALFERPPEAAIL